MDHGVARGDRRLGSVARRRYPFLRCLHQTIHYVLELSRLLRQWLPFRNRQQFLSSFEFIFALFKVEADAVAGEEALTNIALNLTGAVARVKECLVVTIQYGCRFYADHCFLKYCCTFYANGNFKIV